MFAWKRLVRDIKLLWCFLQGTRQAWARVYPNQHQGLWNPTGTCKLACTTGWHWRDDVWGAFNKWKRSLSSMWTESGLEHRLIKYGSSIVSKNVCTYCLLWLKLWRWKLVILCWKKSHLEIRAEESGVEQVENTSGDSFELYYGLFMYNPNATEEVKSLHSSQGHW